MPKKGPHKRNKLSALDVSRSLKAGKPRKMCDGGGLWLVVSSPTSAYWTYRYHAHSRDHTMGLGNAFDVSLAKARERAGDARTLLKTGHDPIAERQRLQAVTFGACADEFIKSKAAGWRDPRTAEIRRRALDQYASDLLPMPVAEVGVAAVKRVLEPIWTKKREAARRLKNTIQQVLDFAAAHDYRSGENPCRLVANVLGKPSTVVEHHKALPVAAMPNFMRDLRERDGAAARALEFLMLTAARTGEVIGMTWAEVDLDGATWTVPAERMKSNREHIVPLSDAAVAILSSLPSNREPKGHVFVKDGRPLSNMAMAMLLRRMKVDVTVHGFRSTFRDWCAEHSIDREVAELALAHRIGSSTEQAYNRTDLLDRRRKVMRAWANYCAGNGADTSNIVPLRSAELVS